MISSQYHSKIELISLNIHCISLSFAGWNGLDLEKFTATTTEVEIDNGIQELYRILF